MKKGILTESDHRNLTDVLGHILDDYKDGTITRVEATGIIAHGFGALDAGEESEVRTFLSEKGRKRARHR